jgi:hypothetical protein
MTWDTKLIDGFAYQVGARALCAGTRCDVMRLEFNLSMPVPPGALAVTTISAGHD